MKNQTNESILAEIQKKLSALKSDCSDKDEEELKSKLNEISKQAVKIKNAIQQQSEGKKEPKIQKNDFSSKCQEQIKQINKSFSSQS